MNYFLQFPKTTEEWKKIALDFQERWDFPHCLGAMDGKYVQITAPVGSGSYYFNYKKTFSIVLMGIENANYEFIYCDVGTNGRVSDGGVIENTKFMKYLAANKLNLPPPETVVPGEPTLNYVFVGDEAFAIRHDFLKPYNQRELDYPKKVFNYRLSRARRVVENTFGILANRFRASELEETTWVPPSMKLLENVSKVFRGSLQIPCMGYMAKSSTSRYLHQVTTAEEDWKCRLHPPALPTDEITWICSECGDWMCKPSVELPKINMTLHEALQNPVLGISEPLCDDLVVCLSNPRYQVLS
ncbi:unnamed protein product [Acanthoscelides obtectus]|uniref:DDE Tnp4 domain-containing protein n=1 Tax=Acanthoscelides obtectus TaxID=200917 RepID=A0A9P0MFU8_ACAOB|nr:unnamed protein product [Acanthoscelides obtectus]